MKESDFMMERPPRPHFIWHGTAPKNVSSIMKEGIKPTWGYVYACFELADCFRFFALSSPRFDYERRLIVENPVIDFLKIDTSKLDWSKAQYSADHDPTFYGCEAIEYEGVIPPDAIVRVKRFNREDNFKQIQWNPMKTDYERTQPMPEEWGDPFVVNK